MRNIFTLATATVVLAFGASNAYAMGGGGNLSPEESPYAILEPQTVTPMGALPLAADESAVVHEIYHTPKHRPRRPRATK